MTPTNSSAFYDSFYYQHGCGERPYQRDEAWLDLFRRTARKIADRIHPGTVLDAGCAMGFLVEGLRREGVQAYGVDVSEYALSMVHPDIQPFCWRGSITEPFPKHYDLITCIEVLEHLPQEDGEKAIVNLCQYSDDILFSSTPFDYKEATHYNVQPVSYWVYQFARCGFYRDVDFDGSFITPWTIRFRKSDEPLERIVANYERKFWLIWQENQSRRELNFQQRNEIAEKDRENMALREELYEEIKKTNQIVNSNSWKFIMSIHETRKKMFPPGSRREKLHAAGLRGLRVLRQEGLWAFIKRIYSKIYWQTRVFVQTIRFRLTRPQGSKLIEVLPAGNKAELPPHLASVDVIVCVHNAYDDVVRCLDSITHFTSKPYTLILVDDGSDEPTASYLKRFSEEQKCRLVRNEKARGYTFAANQGMRESQADYVVLLNSDTIVTDGWIDRMVACAESGKDIGIVGPLSNTASWQSIPDVLIDGDWADNPLPPDVTVNDMGTLVARYSARAYPRIAFLNGFCLMIKRAVIEDIGIFDEEKFGRGYGEENDYCLRARKAGWELVLADDVYIFHAQSKSYSTEQRKKLAKLADKALVKKHGQEIISNGVGQCRNDRVLKGIRARARFLPERKRFIERGNRAFNGKKVLFVLPTTVAGGGSNIVLLEAKAMRLMGVDAQVVNLRKHWGAFESSYPNIDVPVVYCEIDELPEVAAKFDAVVATLYNSVYWIASAAKINPDLIFGYYIQDFEPFFFKKNTKEYHQAWESFTHIPGIRRFSKTRWTARQVFDNMDIACHEVGVSLDVDLFLPRSRKDGNWPQRPVRISAMIRPSTPRRSPKMTMRILKNIHRKYGGGIEIFLFGADGSEPGFSGLPLDFDWKLAGVLNTRQVASLINETDIFVDFSTYQAMGLTALEAMACGNAVVVPEKGGARSFAFHEENALVVDTSDERACFASLERLIADHALREKLQTNAINSVPRFYPEQPAFGILDVLFGQGGGQA